MCIQSVDLCVHMHEHVHVYLCFPTAGCSWCRLVEQAGRRRSARSLREWPIPYTTARSGKTGLVGTLSIVVQACTESSLSIVHCSSTVHQEPRAAPDL